jgi:effector-binding domain-containing protein
MPLNQIAEVLELKGAKAAQAIAAYWAEVEVNLKIKRKLVHYLEDYLEGKGETMNEVLTRLVAQQKVASIQQGVYVKDLPGFIDSSTDAIFDLLAKNKLEQSGPHFVIFHGQVNDDSAGPVEVCVPFEGSVEPVGRIRIRLEPAHSEAYTRITKSQVEFPGILKAYDSVDKWLKTNKTHMIDSPREVYFADWHKVGSDQPACDVAFPYSP